jgi:hypothetical protein
MALPPSLLQQVEQHGCFSGCFGTDADVRVCLDPNRAPEPMVVVSCQDCLSFKLGVLQTLLPPGTNQAYWVADQLTRHLRKLRGYTISFSGYHARGPGFWLAASYFGPAGLFLLDGARSRSLGSDLDLLLLAFKHGVAAPPDPRMLDPKQYATQVAYVDFSRPLGAIQCKAQLLASPLLQAQPQKGFHRVTLAEFLPVASQAGRAPATPATPVVVTLPPRPLKPGDTCPVCKAEVKARPLLNGTYVGCLCG